MYVCIYMYLYVFVHIFVNIVLNLLIFFAIKLLPELIANKLQSYLHPEKGHAVLGGNFSSI